MLDVMSLTVGQVVAEVERVRESAGDPEKAHSLEHALHEAVLYAVAIGTLRGRQAQLAALAAYDTRRIVFPRWTA